MLVGTFLVANINPARAIAEGEDNNTEEVKNADADADNSKKSESTSPYSYVAQPGDSYTKIARKAVQTYGINNNVNLSQAQIIAAETFLTRDANSPSLKVGESVVLSEDAVKDASNKAKDLSEDAQSLWQKYVQYANFNTDKVGQA